MAGLLVLLGPVARIGARAGPRASWLLGALAPCAPPPLFLPPLRPGPHARLLCAARGDSGGRQVSLSTAPHPTPTPASDPGSTSAKGELLSAKLPET